VVVVVVTHYGDRWYCDPVVVVVVVVDIWEAAGRIDGRPIYYFSIVSAPILSSSGGGASGSVRHQVDYRLPHHLVPPWPAGHDDAVVVPYYPNRQDDETSKGQASEWGPLEDDNLK